MIHLQQLGAWRVGGADIEGKLRVRIITMHHCNQLISSLLLVLSNSSHHDVMSVVDILPNVTNQFAICQGW